MDIGAYEPCLVVQMHRRTCKVGILTGGYGGCVQPHIYKKIGTMQDMPGPVKLPAGPGIR